MSHCWLLRDYESREATGVYHGFLQCDQMMKDEQGVFTLWVVNHDDEVIVYKRAVEDWEREKAVAVSDDGDGRELQWYPSLVCEQCTEAEFQTYKEFGMECNE